jgi:hypothetical protein
MLKFECIRFFLFKKSKKGLAAAFAKTLQRNPVHRLPAKTIRYVFWLSDQPVPCAFPVFTSGGVSPLASTVPDYSGGPATDLHRVPLHRIGGDYPACRQGAQSPKVRP